MNIINSFEIDNEKFYYYDIKKVIDENEKLKKLPRVLKILLEENLRKIDDTIEFERVINLFLNRMDSEIKIYPSRIVLDESLSFETCLDMAILRDEETTINPKLMLDLILDSSFNNEKEEKYKLIKWASTSFSNLRIVPPKNKDINPIFLETLSTILHLEQNEEKYFLYPEMIIGNNTLGVIGFHIDGIKLLATIFGDCLSISFPKVVGINIKDNLEEVSSSSIVELIKNRLKDEDLAGKIVEFYGKGLKYLSIEDRIDIINMSNQFETSSFFFPIDEKTIEFLDKTRENNDLSKLIKRYLEVQNLFFDEDEVLEYDESIDLELSYMNKIDDLENSSFLFKDVIQEMFIGCDSWEEIETIDSNTYIWDEDSVLIQPLRVHEKLSQEKIDIKNGTILALLGDSVLTEQISPKGKIPLFSATSRYLESKGVKSFEYDSFESRSTNSKVILTGAFESKDIRNQMVSKEGGFTIDYDTGEIVPIYKEALKFKEQNKDSLIFAGENFGLGKNQERAAKTLRLLGIKAIVAKSFDEDFRICLIEFGVLPLEFIDDDIETLKLKGRESISINSDELKEDAKVATIVYKDNIEINIELKCRLDSSEEVEYYKKGGLIPFLV